MLGSDRTPEGINCPRSQAPTDGNFEAEPGIDWVGRLRAFIEKREFPCVGAKAVLNRDWLGAYVARDLESAWDDLKIHDRLLEWAYDYRDNPTGLRSFAVIFAARKNFDERQFEALMWERLQSLADKDHWRGQKLDASVSADPQDPHFSLSFGGQAFFVVGLHPCASRKARRFDRPTLIFNLHDQFERLREEGRYETMRRSILTRDEAYSGSINPMLARHGDASEARQYSGRVVDEDWSCPFSDPRTESK